MADTLSFNRISLLLRAYAISNYKTWLITTCALFGIMFFYSSVLMNNRSIDNFYQNAFSFVLYLFGILMTSKSFDAVHDKTQSIDFLSTPASSLEKTITPIVICSVIFPIYLIVIMATGSFIIESFNSWYLNKSDDFFNHVQTEILIKWLNAQAIFLLGAISFANIRIAKTILSIGVIFTALTLFTAAVSQIIFPENFYPFRNLISFRSSNPSINLGISLLISTLCWTLTWMKVKEAQLNHAI